MRFPAIVLVFALAGAGCGGGGSTAVDAAADGPVAAGDAAAATDAVAPLTWVDFAVDGCPVFDPSGPACRGAAPLTLRFAAIAPAPVEAFIWTFGDGETSDETSPVHAFALPGIYDVTLVAGGAGGTAMITKASFVVIDAAQTGAACDVAGQCADGECMCGEGASCPPALSAGLCARRCGDGCDEGTACADLGSAEEWQGGWCLASCIDDGGCLPGSVCRDLRDAGTGGWSRVCFPAGILVADGGSCAAPDGSWDGDLCASHRCAPFGARGLCGGLCGSDDDCPSGSACAMFGDGTSMCLAGCGSTACATDPWLACEAPGASGELGFTVEITPDPAGYCAPRRCTTAEECGLDAACPEGYCAAES